MFIGNTQEDQLNEVIIKGMVKSYDFMCENKNLGCEWYTKYFPDFTIKYLGKSKVTYHNGRREVSKNSNHFWKKIN